MKWLYAYGPLNLFSSYLATAAFELLVFFETFSLIYLTRGFEFAINYVSQDFYIACSKNTFLIVSFIYFLFTPMLLRLAGYVTVRIRFRYGLAYTFLFLAIGLTFFVPTVVKSSPIDGIDLIGGIGLVLLMALVPAFFAGYVQGWFLDYWTSGTKHEVIYS